MIRDFEKLEPFTSKKYPQFLAACVASIGSIALGSVVGWSSPTFVTIRDTERFSNLTDDELTWVASLVPLGAISATPIASWSVQNIGRQRSMLFLCLLLILSWLSIAIAQNEMPSYIGRFITGMCSGSVLSLIPIYVSEICEQSIRGLASGTLASFCGLGIFLTYVTGYFVSWETLSFICLCVPILYSIGLYYVPESPTFLLEKGHKKLAAKSLKWLRGAETLEQIEPELNRLYEEINSQSNVRIGKTNSYFQSSTIRPVLIVFLLHIFQQLSGINIVIFYSSKLFQSAGSELDPNLCGIIISGISLLSVSIGAGFIDKAGRKLLFIISSIGSGIGLVGLGIFFYLKSMNGEIVPENLGWLPLGSLTIFVISFNIGLGPIPFIFMGEALPPSVKASASGFAMSLNWMLAFGITNSFESLSQYIGSYSCYWVLAGSTFIGAIFTIFFVPETKGKSLVEIQNSFTRPR